ncbi:MULTISPECIES: SDR family oxidoreductase [unclassified Rhodococcus (in: high G+C Gram-positive bacteria)]|uniref:SDR family oxidoreductase n=1 Tax=unclassified Rhodococcus (in: high G+C Gram-positive bacteria) TaxID=192944 RepID=UPI000926D1DC|nr:SDR family oxidoreductase [Rhodococcus sp. M8]
MHQFQAWLVGFTRQTLFDYAYQNMRVNTIAPDSVETVLFQYISYNEDLLIVEALRSAPAGRHAPPGELANVALFPVGDEASFVQGAVYVADGGWAIR